MFTLLLLFSFFCSASSNAVTGRQQIRRQRHQTVKPPVIVVVPSSAMFTLTNKVKWAARKSIASIITSLVHNRTGRKIERRVRFFRIAWDLITYLSSSHFSSVNKQDQDTMLKILAEVYQIRFGKNFNQFQDPLQFSWTDTQDFFEKLDLPEKRKTDPNLCTIQ